MPTRKTPVDLSEYAPDAATADAMADEPAKYNKDVDPKLRERLEELRRMSSPSLPRIAPPSEATYVAPTAPPANNVTLPRAAKVNVAPPRESDRETEPSLRRLEGEPELPGVERRRTPAPVSLRTAVLAVLAVLAPVVLVVALMSRGGRQHEGTGAAPTTTVSAPAVTLSATVATAPTVTATVEPSATVVPSVTAVPSAMTVPSAAVPAAASAASPKPKARATADDPYDAAPPGAPAPTAAPSVTAAASAPPPPRPSAEPPPKFFR